ncbi:hypothetical protein PVAP13_3NG295100 [Panicum virgatum]|uniref:HTH myb-type domain-containing protein n=1 Tax=Panicum virgatum TaxID=38727 RepID=A0A8T0UBA9_PANVG|nr:hypothetical protein PVAP13_3NG295100 [Panicum virgatum]
MPNLRKLKLAFNASNADQQSTIPVGIEYLSELKEVSAKICGVGPEESHRRAAELAFRDAIRVHDRFQRVNVQCVKQIIECKDDQSSITTVEYSPHDSIPRNRGGGGGSDEPARMLKRPRLVWTPQLHKRFVDAVAHLGIKNAMPKTIMQLMSVDGLTRENVASHLQKYRLYHKRMQGLGGGGGGGGCAGGSHSSGSGTDAATEHLFATGPVPFLPYPCPPFAPMGAAHHHHHHAPQIGHFHHPAARPLGHYGPTGAGFDHGFLSRAVGAGAPPVGPPGMHHHRMMAPASFADDMDLGSRGGPGGLYLKRMQGLSGGGGRGAGGKHSASGTDSTGGSGTTNSAVTFDATHTHSIGTDSTGGSGTTSSGTDASI